MALRTFGALALAASCVTAFQNTSPLFLYSTSPLKIDYDGSQIVTSEAARHLVIDSLRECPTDTYIVISQKGVHEIDYTHTDSTPHLRSWISGLENSHSSFVIPEVIEGLDGKSVVAFLKDKCGAFLVETDPARGVFSIESDVPRVFSIEFPELSPSPAERERQIRDHDSFLHALVTTLENAKHTLIYTTAPREWDSNDPAGTAARPYEPVHSASIYEMEEPFQSSLHTELKRDIDGHDRNGKSNPPLFEKYQFFSPGIFTGLLASFFLLSILYVGITALSSLEVSYYAFSKEMGPSAQRQKQG